MKKKYLIIILFSCILNLVYYLCVILVNTDSSIKDFFTGLINNFPTSFYYLIPSFIPSLYFTLFGIVIYNCKNKYYNLLLSFILIGLDIIFIKLFYGEINIGKSLLFIRVLFTVLYTFVCTICLASNTLKSSS